MTRKKRRLMVLLLAGLGLGTATALTLTAFQDNLVFFLSPSDIVARQPSGERAFRLGGLVETGSVERHTGSDGRPAATFRVSDGPNAITVTYAGVLPDLFREGQGVVTLGGCYRMAVSAPPKCWPATTRPTCRPKWPTRCAGPATGTPARAPPRRRRPGTPRRATDGAGDDAVGTTRRWNGQGALPPGPPAREATASADPAIHGVSAGWAMSCPSPAARH